MNCVTVSHCHVNLAFICTVVVMLPHIIRVRWSVVIVEEKLSKSKKIYPNKDKITWEKCKFGKHG